MIYDKNFLIITAHPDDLEMGCGGLVSKIKAHGGSVTNLILVKPSVEQRGSRNKEIVEKELKESSNVLGMEVITYDTPLHGNGRPNLVLDNNLITFAESVAEDKQVLISHWREDHHQDHRVCYDVARSIARKGFEQFWCMDEPPYNLHYRQFQPNLYVDITDHLDKKIQALGCYNSYFAQHDIDQIINYNRYRGGFIGPDKVAETFNLVYNKTL